PQLGSATRIPVATSAPPSVSSVIMRFGHDFREGLETVITLPWIWITIVLACIADVFEEGLDDVTTPYLVQRTLHASALLYSGLTAATSVGAILGTLWFGGRRLRHRGWLIFGYYIIAVLMFMVLGLLPTPPVMLVAMLLFGLFSTVLGLAWINALQEYVPPERLGRVSSLDELGSYLLNPVSYGVAGVATDHFGATSVLIWGGILSAGIFALGLMSRSVRRLD
ncbi:MAG TPA: MFS transporter, partial [Ktedonobacterales bacterium]|nr:MFS transporter [Ktedonobacterales bacterium]